MFWLILPQTDTIQPMSRVLRPLFFLVLMASLPGLAVARDPGHGRAPPPQQQEQQQPQQQSQRDTTRELRRDPSALPDSVRRVERSTGGEVLSAEPMQRDGREVYRIKVLTADGRVRVMQEDPQDRRSGPHGSDRKQRNREKDREASPTDGQDADQDPPPY